MMPHLQMGKLRCNDVKSPSHLSCVLGALYLNPVCWIPRCQLSVIQDKETPKEDFQEPQREEQALSSGNLQACGDLGGVVPVSCPQWSISVPPPSTKFSGKDRVER